MRLGAVYNQMFISPLMFNNKKVNNSGYDNDNDGDSDKIVDTLANFIMTLDDNGKTVSGTYNGGSFSIYSPNEFYKMVYGEIKETNTKFITEPDSMLVYGQNFYNNYDVYRFPASNTAGLFVTDKNVDPTSQDFANHVIWAHVGKLNGYELYNSTSLQTVLLNECEGSVFSNLVFGNPPKLTTITLSDNKPYSKNGIAAFRDCSNVKDVRIILYKKDTPNIENIEIIKNSFPNSKPTFTLYNPSPVTKPTFTL